MIPKRIISIWVGGEPTPLARACMRSHSFFNYEHIFINDNTDMPDSKYLRACLDSKKWVKAADYLRLFHLYEKGGVYLDSDMDLLRPLDDLMGHDFFVGKEENGFIANSVIGSVAGHPILKACLDEMENLDGSDDKVFEYGMELFSKHCYQNQDKICILTPDYFFPFNHQTMKTHHTDNTRTFHHFTKSWL